jgi:hypothetical protein
MKEKGFRVVTHTKPLAEVEREKFGAFSESAPPSKSKFESRLSPDEIKRRRLEGRAKAIPKSAYSQAIGAFCLECQGVNPAITDCEGNLCDCTLYPFNSAKRRLKSTKTALKKAIKAECRNSCTGNSQESCSSLECALYPFFQHWRQSPRLD